MTTTAPGGDGIERRLLLPIVIVVDEHDPARCGFACENLHHDEWGQRDHKYECAFPEAGQMDPLLLIERLDGDHGPWRSARCLALDAAQPVLTGPRSRTPEEAVAYGLGEQNG